MSTYSRLLSSYQAQDAAIRARVQEYIRRAWPTGSWRDADIERFVAAVLPVVLQGQLQTAKLTEAHLRQVDEAVFGIRRPVALPVARRDVADLRTGVTPEDVYKRSGITVWAALASGKPLAQATQLGLRRALTLANTDLQLAKTTTASRRVDADPTITSYRRTLTGRESCALCSIASQHIYRRGDLMPIHGNCDCGIAAVRGSRNPAAEINRTRVVTDQHLVDERFGGDEVELESAADAVNEQPAVVTRVHGEIGPVLSIRGQKFTDEGDLAA